ncbi:MULTISPECIES: response regulator transcription factor [Bacillota]|uniref:Response regulator n=2 Tax=Erysipelotrichaceae TaxID=128827 RepID=A0ABS9R5P3_9FIRM|nr:MULTISPECIES: response regulator [Bacillota]MCH4284982.1 response regulator [Amedibacillus hominis]RGB55203.1 response regulator [Absiella sp. AM22-9]RGB62832.1 response regulator [Absiella sp. AM10-20]RGB72239.1 response regulator [Absiella sp. AM09-50]RGC22990.1 response regulator [Absiella sp. AM54-8XD]
MIKIMVIEDEKIERETLVKILEEHIPNVEVCQAMNGEEALQLYEKKQPSIILADINIPKFSGLEVIRRIQSYGKDCEFLILSSYDYFAYAQEAIRLGVDDFILKPYNIADMLQAVEKVMEKQKVKSVEKQTKNELLDKLEKYTPIMENECFYKIMSNEDDLSLKQALLLLDKQIVCGFCIVGTKEDVQQDMKAFFYQEDNRIITGKLHGEYITFIFLKHWLFPKEKEKLHQKFEAWKQIDPALQVGSIEEDIHIYESYRKAKNNTLAQFANDQKEPQNNGNKDELIQKMIQAFDDIEEEKVKKYTLDYTQSLLASEKAVMEEDIQQLMDSIFIHLKETYADMEISPIAPIQLSATSFQEVNLFIHMNIMKYYQDMLSYRFKNTNHLVRQALKFIDANYRRPITLNDMAEALDVSPFYISKLLNTSMKKTFTELVSERRVEASKELLKTNKRIKEIAYEVGFQGQNYFTKIFKKYTGVTPKVYKNTFEKEEI